MIGLRKRQPAVPLPEVPKPLTLFETARDRVAAVKSQLEHLDVEQRAWQSKHMCVFNGALSFLSDDVTAGDRLRREHAAFETRRSTLLAELNAALTRMNRIADDEKLLEQRRKQNGND